MNTVKRISFKSVGISLDNEWVKLILDDDEMTPFLECKMMILPSNINASQYNEIRYFLQNIVVVLMTALNPTNASLTYSKKH